MYNSDVFVLSSVWEGFGHVIVEALACEVPVLSTNCKSGPGEILEDNRNGRLVPVGDYEEMARRIMEYLAKGNLTIIEEGLKRADDFDVKKIVTKYETLFFDLTK